MAGSPRAVAAGIGGNEKTGGSEEAVVKYVMKKAWQLGCFLLAVLILLFMLAPFDEAGFGFFIHLFTGGFAHFRESLPHLLPGLPALFGFALLLGATLWLLQTLLKGIVKTARGEPREWRPKWTVGFVAMLLAAFGTACTTIGLVHHTVWLLRNDITYDASRGRVTRDINNCRQIITALRLSASDNRGVYPKQLTALVEEGILEREALPRLNQMRTKDGLAMPWNYLPGLFESDPADLPLVVAQLPSYKDAYIVGRNDSVVSLVPKQEYEAALAAYGRHMASKK